MTASVPSSPWKAASNGAHKRHWFIVRSDLSEYGYGPSGRLRQFASYKTSKRAAERLNAEEAKATQIKEKVSA